MSNSRNILTEKQSLSTTNRMDVDIFTDQSLEQTSELTTCTNVDLDDDSQSTIVERILRESLTNEVSTDLFGKNQFVTILSNLKQTLNMNDRQIKSHPPQNMSINPEHNNLSQQTGLVPIGSSSIDSVILPNNGFYESCQFIPNPPILNDARYQQKMVVPPTVTQRKIQVKCQPRQKYRPRTQNESNNSSHYLRCEEGAVHDYPAIFIPPTWAQQSDTNIIEVTLVGIDKQPHPYVIDNKAVRNSLQDMSIFKKDQPNALYFQLTNEDFIAGFKTFMIELIKSKQDEVITKKLIRSRQLDQSMLRFVRYYRDQHGQYQQDIDSQEYSCIMTESYGTVSVEHIGPQGGPMYGREMIFILFKGRIVKDDLSFIITDPTSEWCEKINSFNVNGSLIYFTMPNLPIAKPDRASVCINIYFKNEMIHESTYLYLSLLDQECANLNADTLPISRDIARINLDIIAKQNPKPIVLQKEAKPKPTKRLKS